MLKRRCNPTRGATHIADAAALVLVSVLDGLLHRPEGRVFIGGIHKIIGPDQQLNDLAIVERLQTQAKTFIAFVTALKPKNLNRTQDPARFLFT